MQSDTKRNNNMELSKIIDKKEEDEGIVNVAKMVHEKVINSLGVFDKKEKIYIMYYVYTHLSRDVAALTTSLSE
ncbi:hypothetical protein EZS27_012352 [termite gut metagenome]|uniref:Uncharacterized protein n=1 Tax=termite gut metagenome TaxID=433724 RepID=A0A5J4S103_9ZZZZ